MRVQLFFPQAPQQQHHALLELHLSLLRLLVVRYLSCLHHWLFFAGDGLPVDLSHWLLLQRGNLRELSSSVQYLRLGQPASGLQHLPQQLPDFLLRLRSTVPQQHYSLWTLLPFFGLFCPE